MIGVELWNGQKTGQKARSKSNDAQVITTQVITMGARVTGPELAKAIINVWLESEFAGGNSAVNMQKMNAVDERYRQGLEAEPKSTC